MGQDTVRLDRALLLQQADWVKNLARNLVRDPMGADDVAQETMLAALASPPRDAADARHLRAWLGRVAFNLAHLSTRRSIRRRDREERVARREREDSTAEEVIRSSVLGQVVDAVSELPDPYRTAVRLHYFEGWATADIARETGTSESAVRKRLWRARGRLRRSLDGCHNGERQAWFQALGPWLGGGAWVSSGHPGAGAARAGVRAGQGMAGKLAAAKVAAAVLAAVGLGVGWQQLGSADPSTPANSQAASRIASLEARPVPAGSRRVALGPLASRAHGRTRSDPRTGASGEAGSGPSLEIHVLDTDADAPDPRGVSGSAQPFVGRAVDPSGVGIGGVPIATSDQPEDVLAWTSGSGEFWIDASGVAEHAGAQLVIARNAGLGWATLRRPVLTGEKSSFSGSIPGSDGLGSEPHWLIAAPAVDLAGTVLSQAGMGLEHVEVSAVLRDEALAGLPLRVVPAQLDVPHTETGPLGGFRLASVPSGPGIELVFVRPGGAAISIPVPSFSDASMLLQWPGEVFASRRIEGIVRDANGTPVGGARVALGEEVAWTDARGGFAIETDTDAAPDDLKASKQGFGGSFLASAVATLRAAGEIEVAHVELQLDGTQGTIEGRVESAEGEALLGWFVYAAPDEDAQTSGPVADRGAGPLGVADAAFETAAPVAAEEVAEDGTFTLFVAADQVYRVSAVDPGTGASSEVRAVWAGADRVLLVPRDGESSTPVQLVDGAGNPLRSIPVRAEQAGTGTQGPLVAMLFQGFSNADGSLLLPDPALASSIRAQLPALGWSPPAGMGPSRGNGKTFFVPLPAGFLAEAGEWSAIAAAVAAEDGNGRPVLLGAPSGARARVGFARGRSPLFTLPEGATTLLLLDASGEELLRSEVRREPGSIETVRLPRR